MIWQWDSKSKSYITLPLDKQPFFWILVHVFLYVALFLFHSNTNKKLIISYPSSDKTGDSTWTKLVFF